MTLTNDAVFRMSDFVGGGYSDFWKFKGRYRIVKGSRASKKSKTAALWYISNLPNTEGQLLHRTEMGNQPIGDAKHMGCKGIPT